MGPKDTRKAQTLTKGGKNLKKTPKQPLSIPERLKRLFNSLCAQIDGGHFTNAIKTCDKSKQASWIVQWGADHLPCTLIVLRLAPGDTDAVQTKLFLLLQTEKYGDALALIDSDDKFVFEKAYSLYRSQKEEEVVEVVGSLKQEKGEDDRGVTHLEAQLVCSWLASCPQCIYFMSLSFPPELPPRLVSESLRPIQWIAWYCWACM